MPLPRRFWGHQEHLYSHCLHPQTEKTMDKFTVLPLPLCIWPKRFYYEWYTCSCAQSCPALCNPMDHSLPGSSVHGISQARILEWVTTFCFRESSQPRYWTHVSCIGRWTLYHWATWEVHEWYSLAQTSALIGSFLKPQPWLVCEELSLG